MNEKIEPIEEFEIVCSEAEQLAPIDPERAQIIATLKEDLQVLAMLKEMTEQPVIDKASASASANNLRTIAASEKSVIDTLNGSIQKAHAIHKRWTGLRNLFTDPLQFSKRAIKKNIIDWQEVERKKAADEARRLQAEADEKARKEKARLEAHAEKMKTPEKKEEYQEKAEAVEAPVVNVAPPKSEIRTSKRWKADVVNFEKFFEALSGDHSLRGFVSVQEAKLARAKSANDRIEIPGVRFYQQIT